MRPLLVGLLTAHLVACSSPGAPPPGDTTPPIVVGDVLSFDDSITSALGSHIFLPGDTLKFEIRSQDDVSLTWIGFQLDGVFALRDSLQIPDSLRHVSVGVGVALIPAGTVSGLLTVRAFARDSAGNIAELGLAGSPASFVASVGTFVPQIGFDVAGGFVMDGAPGARRFYWVNGSGSVGVFEDGGRSTTIDLPSPGRDMDFTLSKDSLVVSMPAARAYAIIDLTTAYPTLTTVADTVTAAAHDPWGLRVVSGGHAIVYRRDRTDTAIGSYVNWDIGTGEQRLLPATSVHGGLERTANRAHVIAWDLATCCGGHGQVYSATTASFAAPVVIGATSTTGVTINAEGSQVLVGNTLLALPALSETARFHVPGLGPTALSQDGNTLFASTAQGILRVRVRDGVGYDLLTVGNPPPRLFATPDGSQLFMPFSSFVRYADLPPLPARTLSRTAGATSGSGVKIDRSSARRSLSAIR
jgi:hypothetical protein